ncbi:MAG: Rho termination factor N-terminal domain-containing protein [Pseudomonadota bacterium]
MSNAKKTDPKLWERVKDDVKASDKGGEPGQWSARKAQLAVQAYKRRGGGYEDDGPSQDETDLNEWTEADWGTKSGRESGASGERYLPKLVRMLLTDDEYERSTAAKKEADGQFSDQPDDVAKKAAKIREDGPTKAMLVERARDLEIEGRSTLSKDELLKAIEDATDENGRKVGSRGSLAAKSKAELYDLAKSRDIDGRSSMDRGDLIDALAGERS